MEPVCSGTREIVNDRDLISVIIPVYNGERYLAEAIESVLAQSCRPLEVIVVDDGSTDGTAAVAGRFASQVHYVQQPNRGPAAARNRGLEIARGDIICFLDADDLLLKTALETQLSYLDREPGLAIAIGYCQMFRHITQAGAESQVELYPRPILLFIVNSMAIRKRVFDRIGPLDESLPQSEDLDWPMRAREQGVSMLVHQEVIYHYRRHGNNLTNQKTVKDRYFLKALKQSLDRRRLANPSSEQLNHILFAFQEPCYSETK